MVAGGPPTGRVDPGKRPTRGGAQVFLPWFDLYDGPDCPRPFLHPSENLGRARERACRQKKTKNTTKTQKKSLGVEEDPFCACRPGRLGGIANSAGFSPRLRRSTGTGGKRVVGPAWVMCSVPFLSMSARGQNRRVASFVGTLGPHASEESQYEGLTMRLSSRPSSRPQQKRGGVKRSFQLLRALQPPQRQHTFSARDLFGPPTRDGPRCHDVPHKEGFFPNKTFAGQDGEAATAAARQR